MKTVIVVPCYNEADRLDRAAFRDFAAAHAGVTVLFVDDGSTDATGVVLAELAAEEDRFDVLALERNGGKCEAVRQGMMRALGDGAELAGYWDADLATPLDEIPRFAARMAEEPDIDILLGSRVKILGSRIDRRPLRHYFGRLAATAASMTLRLPVYDTQCGAKLFRNNDEVRALFEEPFCSGWCFDVEILARLQKGRRDRGETDVGRGLVELPVRQWSEVAGSKVRPLDFLRAFIQLARIRSRYR